jgi:hypothetical protein
LVQVSSRGSGKETTNVDGGVQVHRLSADVGSTSGTAPINSSERVARTLVAKLTKQVIDDTITTVRKSTIRSASIGGIQVVGGTIIALFTSINDTVSASGKLAVETAAAGSGVGVESSSITNFARINTAITTLLLTTGRAAIAVSVVTIITSLSTKLINDTITTPRDTAPRSAGIRGVSIGSTVITFF